MRISSKFGLCLTRILFFVTKYIIAICITSHCGPIDNKFYKRLQDNFDFIINSRSYCVWCNYINHLCTSISNYFFVKCNQLFSSSSTFYQLKENKTGLVFLVIREHCCNTTVCGLINWQIPRIVIYSLLKFTWCHSLCTHLRIYYISHTIHAYYVYC